MNIFYIPSWYPSKKIPHDGIFFRDQALALGRNFKNVKVLISRWHEEDYNLPLYNPPKSIINFFRYLGAKSSITKIGTNVFEVYHPSLEWSQKIFPHGYLVRLLKVNLKNFLASEKKFGRIDIIHAHVSFPAGLLAMDLSRKFGIPYVITEHMGQFPYDYLLKKGKLSDFVKIPLKKAGKIIAVSNSLRKKMEKYGFRDIKVIPNMVDEKFFRPKVQPKNNKNFTFFSLGLICSEKGFGDLVTAAAKVLKKGNNFIFRIGGEGDNLALYKKITSNLDNIQWLGRLSREEALKEYQNCNAFILPSHLESFGIVFAEAMACGKPVIATKCGGPEEIVTKNSGLLVRPKDIKAIERAIIYMAKNRAKYSSKQIRKEFMDKFSSIVVTKEILATYQEAINQ